MRYEEPTRNIDMCKNSHNIFALFFWFESLQKSLYIEISIELYRIWDKDPAENRNFRNFTILKSRYLEDYWTDFENFGCFWKMRSSTCQKTELERLARSFSIFLVGVNIVFFRKIHFHTPITSYLKPSISDGFRRNM